MAEVPMRDLQVRLVKQASWWWIFTDLLSKRHHIFGLDLQVRPSSDGGRFSSTQFFRVALNRSEGSPCEPVGSLLVIVGTGRRGREV